MHSRHCQTLCIRAFIPLERLVGKHVSAALSLLLNKVVHSFTCGTVRLLRVAPVCPLVGGPPFGPSLTLLNNLGNT